MTGILDRIRNTTVADLENVSGSFDDVAPAVYTPRIPKNMVRIVEGADDLKVSRPAPANPGMVKTQDWTGNDSPMAREARCLECDGFHRGGASCGPTDARSEGQVRYMDNLIEWITEKDQAAGNAARTWTDNVTTAGKWSYDKADKFSISSWIDRLKAKNAELNETAKTTPVAAPTNDFSDVPDGYYAVDGPEGMKFYRFRTAGRNATYPGRRYLKVQASDEFHPIRNASTKATILTAIRDAGPAASMALYGQHIGSCGRCNRTLTDAVSRTRGIGPDCWGKM
jgi:hypothetical protein